MRSSEHRTLFALLAVLLLVGCSSERDIRAQCELTGASVRLSDRLPANLQLGVLDDDILLTTLRFEDNHWQAQWFGRGGTAPRDPVDFGFGERYRPQWQRVGESLEGLLLASSDAEPTTPPHRAVGWWSLAPDAATRTAVSFDVDSTCSGCATLANGNSGVGFQGAITTDLVDGRIIAGLMSVPAECPQRAPSGEPWGSLYRTHLLQREPASVVPVNWGRDPCAFRHGNAMATQAPAIVALPEERVGVFFRRDEGAPTTLEYLVTDLSGTVLSGPRVLGGDWQRFNTFSAGGQQARAVRIGDTLLFTDGLETATECSELRRANLDGTDADDTPWQLPCRNDASRRTLWIELERYGDLALMVWSERSATRSLRVTSRDVWDEGIWLALLTAEGRLASEPIRLTSDASTALSPTERTADSGPFAADFFLAVGAQTEGQLQVAWIDRRLDAPGVYLQEVTCAPLEGAE